MDESYPKQSFLRKKHNCTKIYNWREFCSGEGFLIKLIWSPEKYLKIEDLPSTSQEIANRRGILQDPLAGYEYFMAYSLGKHKRWQLLENKYDFSNEESNLTVEYQHIKKDRIGQNMDNPHAESFQKNRYWDQYICLIDGSPYQRFPPIPEKEEELPEETSKKMKRRKKKRSKTPEPIHVIYATSEPVLNIARANSLSTKPFTGTFHEKLTWPLKAFRLKRYDYWLREALLYDNEDNEDDVSEEDVQPLRKPTTFVLRDFFPKDSPK